MARVGVLVISHGSRNREWVRLVDEAIQPLRTVWDFPVVGAFLEIVEGRLIQDGIDELEAQGVTDIIAVPLFISSGSGHVEEISWALGAKEHCRIETDLTPYRLRSRIHWCAPIDADPDIADILYEKMIPLSKRPDREIVLVVGHGSMLKGFHSVWRGMLERIAQRLKEKGGFAAADGAMLLPNQIPWKLKLWGKKRPESDVLVVPLFVSEGYFTEKVIPARFEGYDVRYNGRSLLPHPLLTHWMERRIAEKLEETENVWRKERD
ncbi:sirohydrochlorin chelatase [Paenibacillus thermotolerans]|uniref:sirohydrochlorin chelatase n=1 Tax=Paenibacillus thermotolerans TaxID=3027807 RepID=UPI002368DAEE|nr:MULTISPECIES: CbiX/SirB N-terminal domain-containing protein [unclassified Paenibacillus]